MGESYEQQVHEHDGQSLTDIIMCCGRDAKWAPPLTGLVSWPEKNQLSKYIHSYCFYVPTQGLISFVCLPSLLHLKGLSMEIVERKEKYTHYSAGGSLSESCLLLDPCDMVGDMLFAVLVLDTWLSDFDGNDTRSGTVCKNFSSVSGSCFTWKSKYLFIQLGKNLIEL